MSLYDHHTVKDWTKGTLPCTTNDRWPSVLYQKVLLVQDAWSAIISGTRQRPFCSIFDSMVIIWRQGQPVLSKGRWKKYFYAHLLCCQHDGTWYTCHSSWSYSAHEVTSHFNADVHFCWQKGTNLHCTRYRLAMHFLDFSQFPTSCVVLEGLGELQISSAGKFKAKEAAKLKIDQCT